MNAVEFLLTIILIACIVYAIIEVRKVNAIKKDLSNA